MKPNQQFPGPEQQGLLGQNQQRSDDIEMQFTFTKGTASFPLIMKVPKQAQTFDREEARKASVYFMKKFVLFDGGFEPYFKANTSSLNKALSVAISVLRIIAKKK